MTAEGLKDSISAWELKESEVDLLISELNTIHSIVVPEARATRSKNAAERKAGIRARIIEDTRQMVAEHLQGSTQLLEDAKATSRQAIELAASTNELVQHCPSSQAQELALTTLEVIESTPSIQSRPISMPTTLQAEALADIPNNSNPSQAAVAAPYGRTRGGREIKLPEWFR